MAEQSHGSMVPCPALPCPALPCPALPAAYGCRRRPALWAGGPEVGTLTPLEPFATTYSGSSGLPIKTTHTGLTWVCLVIPRSSTSPNNAALPTIACSQVLSPLLLPLNSHISLGARRRGTKLFNIFGVVFVSMLRCDTRCCSAKGVTDQPEP